MSAADELSLSPEMGLVARATQVHVKKVGRVRPGRDPEEPPTVVDSYGRPVEWLYAVFEDMLGESQSPMTVLAYAEAFLRVARIAWALDLDMRTLRPTEYSVLRRVLNDPRRNTTGSKYAARSLLVTEAALTAIYDTAIRLPLGIDVNPVSVVVNGPARPENRSEPEWRVHNHSRKRRIAARPTDVGDIYSRDELARLRAARHPLDKALVQILNETGARVSEVLSITRASLSPEINRIRVLGKSPGGLGGRTIVASDKTFAVIDDYLSYLAGKGVHVGEYEQIFRFESNYERPLNRRGLLRRLAAIEPGANGQKFRRTTLTRLVKYFDGPGHQGLIAARVMAGHRSVTTTEQYLNFKESDLSVDLLEKIERAESVEQPSVARLYGDDVLVTLHRLKEE